jgi:hypothetical protein
MSNHWTDDPLYQEPLNRKVKRMLKQVKALRKRVELLPEAGQHKYLPFMDKLEQGLRHQTHAMSFFEEVIEGLGTMLPEAEGTGEAPPTAK